MTKQTVYVPDGNGVQIDYNSNQPIEDHFEYINRLGLSGHVVKDAPAYFIKTDDYFTAHVLKEVHNAYIFTEQELLELKKKWGAEAWDEAKNSTSSNTSCGAGDWGLDTDDIEIEIDKTYYINNLTLE